MAVYDFTGADGSPPPAGLTTQSGAFEILTNRLVCTNAVVGAGSIVTSESTADGTASVVFNAGGSSSTSTAGLCFRFADVDNQFTAITRGSVGDLRVFKREAAAFTQMGATYSIPGFDLNTNYTIEAVMSGDNITINVNGVEATSFTSSFNNTSTEHGIRVGSGATTAYSFDDLTVPDAIVDSITLDLADYTSGQRDGNDEYTFTLSGAYVGSPTSIEWSYDGVSYFVGDATPTGGTYSFSATIPVGQHTVTVRWSNNTGINDTANFVTVGDGVLGIGQSLMSSRGTNNQTVDANPNFTHVLLGNDDVYKALIDPWDDATNQVDNVSEDLTAGGSWMVHFANQYTASGNTVPVFYIPAAKGGTSSNQWKKPVTVDATSLYGSALRRAQLTGGVKWVMYQQGTADATAGAVTKTQYKANVLQQFQGWQVDLPNAELWIVPLHTLIGATYDGDGVTTGQDAIRAGQLELASENAFIEITSPLTDIDLTLPGNDGVHFKLDADLITCGTRVYDSIFSSTLNLNITGIPDGTYTTVLDDENGNRLFRGNITYSSGLASQSLSIAASSTVKGYVDDNSNPSSNGAYIEGITV